MINSHLVIVGFLSGCVVQEVEDTTCYYDEIRRAELTCEESGRVFAYSTTQSQLNACEGRHSQGTGFVRSCVLSIRDGCEIVCEVPDSGYEGG